MIAYQRTHEALLALKRGDSESALEFLESACVEVSYLEMRYCEAEHGGHDWKPQEEDVVMQAPYEKCSRCGCSRIFRIPEKPDLEVVK